MIVSFYINLCFFFFFFLFPVFLSLTVKGTGTSQRLEKYVERYSRRMSDGGMLLPVLVSSHLFGLLHPMDDVRLICENYTYVYLLGGKDISVMRL